MSLPSVKDLKEFKCADFVIYEDISLFILIFEDEKEADSFYQYLDSLHKVQPTTNSDGINLIRISFKNGLRVNVLTPKTFKNYPPLKSLYSHSIKNISTGFRRVDDEETVDFFRGGLPIPFDKKLN